ncbi:hypothetical protein M0805_005016 [Coniferiporia weirii]|nr:hypothetical protein M0805_005016 [Coniferiporia weirii]
MAELRFQSVNSSMPSVSYIPVMAPTPRKASSSSRSPSAFGIPHFSLLPSPRIVSTGGSPSSTSSVPSQAYSQSQNSTRPVSPSPAPAPNAGSSGTGIPKFRSLRNMLPFGPKQTPIAPSASASSSSSSSGKSSKPPVAFNMSSAPGALRHRRSSSSIPAPLAHTAAVAKNGFMTLGPRASLSLGEKSLPLPPPISRSRSEDLGSSPVICIASPAASTSQLNLSQNQRGDQREGKRDARFNAALPLSDDLFKKTSPTVLVTNAFQDSSQDLSQIRSGGDLSTIIESELSSMSMSKHLPPLDTSEEGLNQRAQASESEEADADGDSGGEPLVLAQLTRQVHKSTASILRAQDLDTTSSSPVGERSASANLSASWEAGLAEFRRTMGMRVHDTEHSVGTTNTGSPYSVSPVSFPSVSREHLSTPARSTQQLAVKDVDATNDPEFEQEQVSFDLSSLDPDLAALLSPHSIPPHRPDDTAAAIAAAVNSVTPPPPVHSSASPSPEPVDHRPRESLDTNAETDDIWLAAAGPRRTSAESRRRILGLQSSPIRKSRPASLALSTSSHSTADAARRGSIDTTPVGAVVRRPAISPMARRELNFKSPGASSEDLLADTARRPPLLARSYSALAGPSTLNATAGDGKRRGPTTRLYAAPARPSTAGSAPKQRVVSDGNRPFPRGSQARDDGPSGVFSPTSRSRSSLGYSASAYQSTSAAPERPGTSLSNAGRTFAPRNRKRSISVTTDLRTPARAAVAPDWMGPRTMRAFAAAGLLDGEREQPRADSRMRLATPRTSTDRDYRLGGGAGSSASASAYAPSRAGFSDVGRSGSWGRRRSMSRTMTMAELSSARGESPVTSATTTTAASSTPTSMGRPGTTSVFSGSTATSISCSSPHQQSQFAFHTHGAGASAAQAAHVESALAALREKHAAEMEALLAALADSQRTSKALREENTRLSGRVRDLEEQFGDLVEQLDTARRMQPPVPPSFARTMLSHSRPNSRSSSVEGNGAGATGNVGRRPARLHPYVSSQASVADDSDSASGREPPPSAFMSRLSPSRAAQLERTARKRASTASSVFPTLPSNMSMLLHDEADLAHEHEHGFAGGYASPGPSSRCSPPPSPTPIINRFVSSSSTATVGKRMDKRTSRRAPRPSVSSIGSGASMSGDISVLSSLPGSPTSLRLRPEHEEHLGDMMSLDLSVIDSD